MNFPDDLKYVSSHEWVRIEGALCTIGITDFAQSELGDVVFVDITASPGAVLGAHDVFGTIEAVKTVSDMFMPVDGEIGEVNPALASNPELINSDPYGQGWIIKVVSPNAASSPDLMDAKAYAAMVGA